MSALETTYDYRGNIIAENDAQQLEADVRDQVLPELIQSVGLRDFIKLLIDRARESLQIGGYESIPKIKGGVGEELDISISTIDLKDYLPEGVIFRGVGVTDEPTHEYQTSNPSPHYDTYRREICVVVRSSNRTCRPTKYLGHSGLIILHEMGHAIDLRENPITFDDVARVELDVKLLEELQSLIEYTVLCWFGSIEDGPAKILNEYFSHSFPRFLNRYLDSLRSQNGDASLKRYLEASDQTEEIFSAHIRKRMRVLWEECFVPCFKKEEESSDVKSALYQTIEERKKRLMFTDKPTATFARIGKLERNAWAKALQLYRLIQAKDPNIVLWTRGREPLFLFIYSLINAHGDLSGRLGVGKSRYREKLSIGD